MSPTLAHIAGLPVEELAPALAGVGIGVIATTLRARAAGLRARLPGQRGRRGMGPRPGSRGRAAGRPE